MSGPVEALQLIAGICEGSRTANSLPHIGKVAREALDTARQNGLDPSPFITGTSEPGGPYYVTVKVHSIAALHAAHTLILRAYKDALEASK